MKNIIQTTLIIAVFLLLIFVVKNTFFKEKNCLDDYPEIIKKYNLEGKYDTAKWVLYASNYANKDLQLVAWDSILLRKMVDEDRDYTTIPPKFDKQGNVSIEGGGKLVKYSECYLEPLLDSSYIFKEEGEIQFGFIPKNKKYSWIQKFSYLTTKVTFATNSDTISSIGSHKVMLMLPRSYIQEKEEKFIEYLDENYENTNCWLKQYYEKHKKEALNSPQNSLSSPSKSN